jgi:hypothetical protein
MLGFAMVITGAVITPTPQVEPDLLVGEELALARSEP